MRTAVSFTVAVVLGSCAPSPVEGGGAQLHLFVDGESLSASVAHVGSEPEPLATLLPEGKRDVSDWINLGALAKSGLRMGIDDPAQTFADHSIALARTKDGRLGLGFFPQFESSWSTADESDWPEGSFVGVAEIHIRTKVVESEPIEESPLLLVVTNADPVPLTREALADLLRIKPRDRDGEEDSRQWGWHIEDVLAMHVDIEAVAGVIAHDSRGNILKLTAEEIHSRELPMPLIKCSRQGSWNLRVWETGSNRPEIGRQLRELAQFEVQLR